MSRSNPSFEERWFGENTSPIVPAALARLETRHGFRPPPPTNGLVFLGVSLVLVAMAVSGVVFFFSPPDSKHERPVSTTNVTSAESWQPPSEPTTAAPIPEPVKVVAVTDLPPAPPQTAGPKAPVKAPAPTPRREPASNGAPEFKIKR